MGWWRVESAAAGKARNSGMTVRVECVERADAWMRVMSVCVESVEAWKECMRGVRGVCGVETTKSTALTT